MVRARQQFRKRQFRKNSLKDAGQADGLAFSSQYHKARRNLVLFSAILFALTYAGFKLTKTGEGYQKQIPNTDMVVSLDNPNIIQTILFVIVLYFGYRLVLEWSLCSLKKQITLAARVDFFGSLFIGYFSLISYLAQRIFESNQTISFYLDLIILTLLSIYLSLIVSYLYITIKLKGFIKIKNQIKSLTIKNKITLIFPPFLILHVLTITILSSPIQLAESLYLLTITLIISSLFLRSRIITQYLATTNYGEIFGIRYIVDSSFVFYTVLILLLVLLVYLLFPDLFLSSNNPPLPPRHP